MNEPCWKGWSDQTLNKRGECCCNCEHQRPISSHPWNEHPLVKGSITKIVGYGCACTEFFPNITFNEREHSFCECWTKNTWREELATQKLKEEKERVWHILERRDYYYDKSNN